MTERYIEEYMKENHILEKMAVGDLVNQMYCAIPVNDGNDIIIYRYVYNPDKHEMEETVTFIIGIRTKSPYLVNISSDKAKRLRKYHNVWEVENDPIQS